MKFTRVYGLIKDFKEYGVLALCIIFSFILLARNDSRQIRAIRSLTIGSIAFLQDAFGYVPNYFSLGEQNHILREMNLSLSDEVSRLREARLENIRLQQMLKFRENTTFAYVAAKVVGKQPDPLRNTITLNVGTNDGVGMNMPIVTDAGLVGKIIATSSDYSVGQTLFNVGLRISARVQRSRVDGILLWQGGDNLVLKDVAKTLDVKKGDALITSDFSSIFPAGIKVGVVQSTSLTRGSLFLNVDITPSVDFSRLEEVFVALYRPDSSRVALEQSLHSH
jgi:rod shape-determining protein MreC